MGFNCLLQSQPRSLLEAQDNCPLFSPREGLEDVMGLLDSARWFPWTRIPSLVPLLGLVLVAMEHFGFWSLEFLDPGYLGRSNFERRRGWLLLLMGNPILMWKPVSLVIFLEFKLGCGGQGFLLQRNGPAKDQT